MRTCSPLHSSILASQNHGLHCRPRLRPLAFKISCAVLAGGLGGISAGLPAWGPRFPPQITNSPMRRGLPRSEAVPRVTPSRAACLISDWHRTGEPGEESTPGATSFLCLVEAEQCRETGGRPRLHLGHHLCPLLLAISSTQ
ncbi:hypothetical protein NDU88_006724 [Pleurodeles waltl]|uniref:Uncharacterized protein n=1 Tax=Pleurodeles waltl TaxID=8319 RepID=A0AAV7MI74_PLEWA|nr:hypothetical protein NDU88_006724 [Pleurodeles waltl]